MEKANKQDYENALRIIKQCQAWVKGSIDEIKNNSDFPYRMKLVLLDEHKNCYHRGGRTTYLVLDSIGLTTVDFCGDGTEWSHDINTCEERKDIYAYNSSAQKTIDLALVLVAQWEDIKSKILNIISNYKNNREINSRMLAEFKV